MHDIGDIGDLNQLVPYTAFAFGDTMKISEMGSSQQKNQSSFAPT